MTSKLLSFNEAVREIQAADAVVIQFPVGELCLVGYRGWRSEGDPKSDFVLGTPGHEFYSGYDLILPYGQAVVANDNRIEAKNGFVIYLYQNRKIVS